MPLYVFGGVCFFIFVSMQCIMDLKLNKVCKQSCVLWSMRTSSGFKYIRPLLCNWKPVKGAHVSGLASFCTNGLGCLRHTEVRMVVTGKTELKTMRKKVTFVDHVESNDAYRKARGNIPMRSAESKNRWNDGFDGAQVGDVHIVTQRNIPAVSQYMKTIHAPKSLMSAPFLQHPALTAGQRGYLSSIANIYSTEHMRSLMRRHRLSVLHSCLQPGQRDSCRTKCGVQQHKDKTLFLKDTVKDASMNKPQRKNRSDCDVRLPKIVNRPYEQ
ncbi:protein FAM216A [Gouania willdenowi]|uniref:Uncharacterized protein n=1 Tax=Gouania willdenowi TaxID=441366 RepID=A0A8C5GCZ7_GOUWI|nr:protein FAM216A [Gouania willdenowi]